MDLWSVKKKVLFFVIIGVILIALISVSVILVLMRSVPDAEDFLKVNTLDNVLDEYGSVYITHQNRILYYEKTD